MPLKTRDRLIAWGDNNERDFRTGRHIHLRTDRADIGDQLNRPAYLVSSRFVLKPRLSRRPRGRDQRLIAADARAPKLFSYERHNRMQ